MRARLFTAADYESLLSRKKIEDIITALTETPYKEDVEMALVRVSGVNCIFEALRTNLTRTLRRIGEFFDGPPRTLIDILLRHWDRHNLLTILRGQSQEVSVEVVLSALIPVGQLDEVSLRELARQPGLRATMDLMTTWRLPYATALSQVRAGAGSVPDLDRLELALNRFHYASLYELLSRGNGNRALVLEQLRIEVDLINIRTALRLARLPEITYLLRQRYQATDICPLLIEPGGWLPPQQLAELVNEGGGLEGVTRGLKDTRYGAALEAGWRRTQTGRDSLTPIERALERWQAEHTAAMFNRNPLSVAIPIGYLGCKALEVANLRLIAQAVALNLKREDVRQELIIVK
jgi:vacuolar-type H+-ATPase subunit C/Vma6